MYKQLEGLVLEETAGGPGGKNVRPEASKTAWLPEKKVETHFAEGMVGNFHLQKPRSFWDFLVSVLGHSFVVALLILLPLYFTDAINIQSFKIHYLWLRRLPRPRRHHLRRCTSLRERRNHFSHKASCLRRG